MIYKSSSFQIVSLVILLLVTIWGFSLPGSAEEKNGYDFSVLQRAFLQGTLASHPDIRKKIEGFLVFIYADIYEADIDERVEDFLILREDRVGDAVAIYTKVKYTSAWAEERGHCGSYIAFLFIKEDDRWDWQTPLSSNEEITPSEFLPPLGTFKNTDAEWEKIPVFLRVPPESDLPFEKVKVTFDDLYVYFRFEFEDKLIPQGEIIGRLDEGEFTEHTSFSIAFDIDNNPETPRFIRGFEREIRFFIGEGKKTRRVDERWRLRTYFYRIKKYAEGILGRLIFRGRVLPIHSHIIIGNKSIILRAPREYLGLKENLEVRISFRYRGRTEVSKTVVIP